MNVYRIWTTRKNQKGQPIFIDVICNLPSLDVFMARLNDKQMVMAYQLWTRFAKDEEGPCLEIVREKPVVIAAPLVQSIEVPDGRFIRFVEE